MSENGGGSGTVQGALRGALAAMAMTGMRSMTRDLGLVRRPPPEEIAEQGIPDLFRRIPVERRHEALELAHWAYGGLGGAAFALLPERVRKSLWSGPTYGLAVWLAFELGLAPLLGIRHTAERPLVGRLAVAADHLLYGLVVASRRGF